MFIQSICAIGQCNIFVEGTFKEDHKWITDRSCMDALYLVVVLLFFIIVLNFVLCAIVGGQICKCGGLAL